MQLPGFVWVLCSSVWGFLKQFSPYIIDAIDRSKISSDRFHFSRTLPLMFLSCSDWKSVFFPFPSALSSYSIVILFFYIFLLFFNVLSFRLWFLSFPRVFPFWSLIEKTSKDYWIYSIFQGGEWKTRKV